MKQTTNYSNYSTTHFCNKKGNLRFQFNEFTDCMNTVSPGDLRTGGGVLCDNANRIWQFLISVHFSTTFLLLAATFDINFDHKMFCY